jgi:hypothetical protein
MPAAGAKNGRLRPRRETRAPSPAVFRLRWLAVAALSAAVSPSAAIVVGVLVVINAALLSAFGQWDR